MGKKETSVKKGAKKSAKKEAEVVGHKKKSAPIKAAKKVGAKKEVDVEGHVVRRGAATPFAGATTPSSASASRSQLSLAPPRPPEGRAAEVPSIGVADLLRAMLGR